MNHPDKTICNHQQQGEQTQADAEGSPNGMSSVDFYLDANQKEEEYQFSI